MLLGDFPSSDSGLCPDCGTQSPQTTFRSDLPRCLQMNLPSHESPTGRGQAPIQESEVVASLGAADGIQNRLETKVRILVVEDNPFVRKGIVRIISRQSDFACCGEADSIASAPLIMAEARPDLVLLDLQLKDGEAFDLIGKLKSQSSGVPILILSQGDETVYAERVLRAGANGYIMKQEAAAELLCAIRTVLRGEIYVSRAMDGRLPRELYVPALGDYPSEKSAVVPDSRTSGF